MPPKQIHRCIRVAGIISGAFRATVALAFVCFMVLNRPLHAETLPEFKAEAGCLFNFLQYVDWPKSAFTYEQSPYVVGVLGQDPFGQILEETFIEEVIKGRKVELRRFKKIAEVKECPCHALFISSSESGKLNSILAALKGRSVLTVSELPDFTAKGGMIQFLRENDKVRFRINLKAARAAKISISAKLLQLSEVDGEKKPE